MSTKKKKQTKPPGLRKYPPTFNIDEDVLEAVQGFVAHQEDAYKHFLHGIRHDLEGYFKFQGPPWITFSGYFKEETPMDDLTLAVSGNNKEISLEDFMEHVAVSETVIGDEIRTVNSIRKLLAMAEDRAEALNKGRFRRLTNPKDADFILDPDEVSKDQIATS